MPAVACPNCLRAMAQSKVVPGLFRCGNPYCIHYDMAFHVPSNRERLGQLPTSAESSAALPLASNRGQTGAGHE